MLAFRIGAVYAYSCTTRSHCSQFKKCIHSERPCSCLLGQKISEGPILLISNLIFSLMSFQGILTVKLRTKFRNSRKRSLSPSVQERKAKRKASLNAQGAQVPGLPHYYPEASVYDPWAGCLRQTCLRSVVPWSAEFVSVEELTCSFCFLADSLEVVCFRTQLFSTSRTSETGHVVSHFCMSPGLCVDVPSPRPLVVLIPQFENTNHLTVARCMCLVRCGFAVLCPLNVGLS